MKREYYKHRIGAACRMAPESETPGRPYAGIWVGVAQYPDGVFEARAKYARGSNQGYLDEDERFTRRVTARGASLSEALDEITQGILEWVDDNITPADRRDAIREAKIDAEDWIAEHGSMKHYVDRPDEVLAEIAKRLTIT
jgi:hypothetical protein